MHRIQQQLIDLAKQQDLEKMSLRQIARLIGEDNKPQAVKHHLIKLNEAGLMTVNLKEKIIKLNKKGLSDIKGKNNRFFSLPIVGSANCGPATIFADEKIEGYLKVSPGMLPRIKKDLYVLVADGLSMNKARVNGKIIDDGDYVIIDSSYRTPKDGDIIVAVIDSTATIKKYRIDEENEQIVLEAESTEKFRPIFIHEGDDFVISGKVIDVIKSK